MYKTKKFKLKHLILKNMESIVLYVVHIIIHMENCGNNVEVSISYIFLYYIEYLLFCVLYIYINGLSFISHGILNKAIVYKAV